MAYPMQLKSCPVPVFGDTGYRGECPAESVEQISFFSRLRREYPDSHGLIAIHPRNEGQLVGRQFSSVVRRNAEGMTKGAADIIIPGAPTFVCEMKRRDHTKSKWEDGQESYLEAAAEAGAFACLALGAEAAWKAFEEWLSLQPARR